MVSPADSTTRRLENSKQRRISQPTYFTVALLLIVVLAAGVRLYRLGGSPQRFDIDEMDVGYEAWSLWSTGADSFGTVLPLHIRGFNEYSLGLPFYITAPFVGILGPSEFSTRLPYALMGIVTVLLTGILGRRWFGPVAGAFAALFLAVDPWHVNFTRLALVVGAVPLFLVLVLLAFTRLIQILRDDPSNTRKQTEWAVLCGLAFALLTLSYAPMKLEAPLLMGICLLAAWSLMAQHRCIAVIWWITYLLCLSPLIYDQLAHWQIIQHHFGQVSVVNMPDWFITLWRNYAGQFDPSSLFFNGLNQTFGSKPAYGIGELFWLEGPLWIAAFVGLVRLDWRSSGFNLPVLLGLWAVTYPVATSLTWGPTEYREINLLPLPELMAGYGLTVVFDWLLRTRFGFRAVVYGVLIPGVFVFGSFCVLSLSPLFAPPVLTTASPSDHVPYNIGLQSVLQTIASDAQLCDQIWLEPTFEAYMAYLFYSRYPPARFQQDHVKIDTDPDGWISISQIDNIHFALPGSPPAPSAECVGKPSAQWFATKSGFISDPHWQQVFTVNNARGDVIWRVQVAR